MLCQWRYRQHYTSDRVQALVDGLSQCELGSIVEPVMGMMGVVVRNGADNATTPVGE